MSEAGSQSGPGDLIGREAERGELQALLARAWRDGGALTLEGDPGAGKTHLLREAEVAGAARGATVLRASGVQYEADLTFGVLHQLVRPIAHRIGELPASAASALRSALGEADSPVTQTLAVYSGLLELLTLISRDAPLLVAIDDLQWIDPSTAAAVAFVARRIDGSSIAIVGAMRRGPAAFIGDDIPVIEVRPLSADASRELLRTRYPDLTPSIRESLVEFAAGYPLALVTWGTALHGRHALSMSAGIDQLPLPRRLEALFAARLDDLPAGTRRALLSLALDGRSSLRDLVRVGLSLDRLAPAEDLGVITTDALDGSVHFTHPLMRSAVVTTASTSDRRRAHLALAEGLLDDPDRRAWHLARAAFGPDETVAHLLEQVARRSHARGDTVGAMATLIRAAEMSPTDGERSRRLAEAAYFGADVTGERSDASRLLESARSLGSGSGSLYAAAARAHIAVNGEGEHLASLNAVAAAVNAGSHGWRADDRELADTFRTWLLLCSYAGDPASWHAYFDALHRLTPAPPRILEIESRAIADPARSGPDVHRMLEEFARDDELCADPGTLGTLATAAMYVDALGPYRRHNRRFVEDGRRGGPLLPYVRSLSHLAVDDLVHGRWDAALELSTEGKAICDEHFAAAGSWFFAYVQGVVAAGRGDIRSARSAISEIERLCRPRESFGAQMFAQPPAVLAAIAENDWEEAYQIACTLSIPGALPPFVPVALWVAFDLVEAAIRIDRHDDARRHAAAMESAGLPGVSSRLALLTAGAQALVAEEAEAEAIFRRAVESPDAAAWPFELARVRLAYGVRLRRSGHSARAREALTPALDGFDILRASPWATRTIDELRAAGDRRFRTGEFRPLAALPLTRQELAVAELAAQGLSNRDIARRLYLSPRTVSGHLYSAFPKLGVSSRAGLRDALSERAARQSSETPSERS